jgi:hypothetical protein
MYCLIHRKALNLAFHRSYVEDRNIILACFDSILLCNTPLCRKESLAKRACSILADEADTDVHKGNLMLVYVDPGFCPFTYPLSSFLYSYPHATASRPCAPHSTMPAESYPSLRPAQSPHPPDSRARVCQSDSTKSPHSALYHQQQS